MGKRSQSGGARIGSLVGLRERNELRQRLGWQRIESAERRGRCRTQRLVGVPGDLDQDCRDVLRGGISSSRPLRLRALRRLTGSDRSAARGRSAGKAGFAPVPIAMSASTKRSRIDSSVSASSAFASESAAGDPAGPNFSSTKAARWRTSASSSLTNRPSSAACFLASSDSRVPTRPIAAYFAYGLSLRSFASAIPTSGLPASPIRGIASIAVCATLLGASIARLTSSTASSFPSPRRHRAQAASTATKPKRSFNVSLSLPAAGFADAPTSPSVRAASERTSAFVCPRSSAMEFTAGSPIFASAANRPFRDRERRSLRDHIRLGSLS